MARSILDKTATYARDKKNIATAMTPTARASILPAEQLIQDVFDEGHAVLTAGQVPRSTLRPPVK